MNRTFAIISVGSILLLAGCTGDLNQTNGVMGTSPETLPALVAESPSSITADAQPSLQGLDRRNWDVVTVLVPRGQVEVQPTYSENLELATGTARDAGTYPTMATALQGASDANSVIFEGMIQPVWPTVLFIAAPARIVLGEWPGQTHREPKSKFQLVPASDSALHGVNWAWVEATKQP